MQTKIDLNEQLNRYATTAQGQIGRGISEYAGYAAAVGAGLAMAGGADAAILYSGVLTTGNTAAIDPSRQATNHSFQQSATARLGGSLPGLKLTALGAGHVGTHYGLPDMKYIGLAGVQATGGAKFLGASMYGGANLAAGAMIGPNGQFAAGFAGRLNAREDVMGGPHYSYGGVGNFASGVTGIAGFKLGNGDYGWIRLKVEDLGLNQPYSDLMGGSPVGIGSNLPDKVKVLDWAVETSGGAIAAGDVGTPSAPSSVPEPSSLALLAAGAAGLAGFRRRRANTVTVH